MSITPPLSLSASPSPIPHPTGQGWQQTRWRDEAAWSSSCGAVKAVVSEARQRLIYLGAGDDTQNLLNAPALLSEDNRANRGGHRFWLGPQKRWGWPPVADWEYSAAQAVQLQQNILVLQQPQQDSAYPAVTREYAWVDHQLRCTARWIDPLGEFFGMHVVAVDVPMAGSAQLVRCPQVPIGLTQVQIDAAATGGFLPHPAVALVGDRAIVHSGEAPLKLGFVRQPLTVDRAARWRLSVQPGPHHGAAGHLPDHGYLTQIWVGGPEYDFAELEQLTPYLHSEGATTCASTIFLAAIPPAAG